MLKHITYYIQSQQTKTHIKVVSHVYYEIKAKLSCVVKLVITEMLKELKEIEDMKCSARIALYNSDRN